MYIVGALHCLQLLDAQNWRGSNACAMPLQVQYPFNIPGNMYVAGALHRLELLDAQNWRDPYIAKTAHRLASDIRMGIEKWGVVEVKVRGLGAGTWGLGGEHGGRRFC